MENTLAVPQKVKQVPPDSAIPLLGIYPKGLKTGTQANICSQIAALFTIAKRWKHPNVHQPRSG